MCQLGLAPCILLFVGARLDLLASILIISKFEASDRVILMEASTVWDIGTILLNVPPTSYQLCWLCNIKRKK